MRYPPRSFLGTSALGGSPGAAARLAGIPRVLFLSRSQREVSQTTSGKARFLPEILLGEPEGINVVVGNPDRSLGFKVPAVDP